MDDQVLQPVDRSFLIFRRLEAYVSTALALVSKYSPPDCNYLKPRFIFVHLGDELSLFPTELQTQLFHFVHCPYPLCRVEVVNWRTKVVVERVDADDYFSLVEQWEAEHGSPTP